MDSRPIALLADLHLKPESPWDAQSFIGWLGRARETIGALYLLGDLFEFWLAAPRLETPFQRQILEAIQRLREAGVTIGYVEGNRDYRVARGRSELFDQCSEDALVLETAGRSALLVHGDRIHAEDRAYRAWRRFSRHPALLGAFLRLPAPLARRAAAAIERRLRRTNLPHKRAFPEPQLRQFAAAQQQRGHDAVVVGHFHRELALRAGAVELFVLGAWGPTYRYLELGGDGRFRFKDAG